MSIGSFLASAGRIGTGIEQYQTDSALRQLQRQQALAAQDALAREAAVRRDFKMLPPLDPMGMPQLGAPMQMEQVSTPEPTTAGVTPPPANITIAPPAASSAPTPGKVRYRALEIDGVAVQPWDTNRPDRLNAGVAGFERVDPNASDFEQYNARYRNDTKLGGVLYKLSQSTVVPFQGVRSPFVSQKSKQALESSQRAADWYQTNDAKDYFRRNPEMLAVAQKNPVNFFDALNQTNQRVTEARSRRAPAGVREEPAFLAESRNLPAWQQVVQGAKSEPTQQTEQVGVSPPPVGTSGSFANIPFAQVKQRIVGREGPAALGGYNALAYNTPGGRNAAGVPQPPKPLTSMTIKEVLDFQRGPMRAATKGYRSASDVGSTGVGAYQFESRTLAENAKIALGEAWMNAPFTPQIQDRIAETLYNRVRGNQAQLANTWFVFKNGGTTQDLATSAAPVPRLKQSDFYLAKEGAIGSDLALALRNRQEIARIADIYQQNGMVEQFLGLRYKLMETDSNLLYLQGMQGIQELSVLRDPRRLESVYSQYIGSPVNFQPRSDGKFNIVVGGNVVQDGIDAGDLINAVRTGIDAQYRTDRTKLISEISMENFKSRLKRQETAEEKTLEAAASIQKALIDGKVQLAKTIAENAGGKITAQGDNVYLQKDGLLYKIDPGGEQVPGAAAGLVTQPSARLVPVGASG
jgi:hypothetical protein